MGSSASDAICTIKAGALVLLSTMQPTKQLLSPKCQRKRRESRRKYGHQEKLGYNALVEQNTSKRAAKPSLPQQQHNKVGYYHAHSRGEARQQRFLKDEFNA